MGRLDAEEVLLEAPDGVRRGPFQVINLDPRFILLLSAEDAIAAVANRPRTLLRLLPAGTFESRPILATTWVVEGFGALELMAPHRMQDPPLDAPYPQDFGTNREVIELRPGSVIL